jgi:hypothetical protein
MSIRRSGRRINLRENAYSVLDAIYLAGFVILFILQIYLSKRKNKIPGLVIPAFFLLQSLATQMQFISWDIAVMDKLQVFGVQNIPTAVFALIYIICRSTLRKNEELEKMNIKDL